MLNSNPKYDQQKEKEKIESNVYNSDTIYNIYDIILFCQAQFTLGWKSAEWTRR